MMPQTIPLEDVVDVTDHADGKGKASFREVEGFSLEEYWHST